jgi:hypothetical protein
LLLSYTFSSVVFILFFFELFNRYDLQPQINAKYSKYGFGVYHSGVEIDGKKNENNEKCDLHAVFAFFRNFTTIILFC